MSQEHDTIPSPPPTLVPTLMECANTNYDNDMANDDCFSDTVNHCRYATIIPQRNFSLDF